MTRKYQAILGAGLAGIAILIFCSVFGYHSSDYSSLLSDTPVKHVLGTLGAWIGHIVRTAFGNASYYAAFALALPGISLMMPEGMRNSGLKTALVFLFSVNISALFTVLAEGPVQTRGGYIGMYMNQFIESMAGARPAYILLVTLVLCNAVIVSVVWLSPRRERLFSNGIVAGIRAVFSRNNVSVEKQELPLLRIGISESKSAKRQPWVTKKRMVVYETEKIDDEHHAMLSSDYLKAVPDRKVSLLTDGYSEENAEPIIDENMTAAGCADEGELVLREGEYYIEGGFEEEAQCDGDVSDVYGSGNEDEYDVALTENVDSSIQCEKYKSTEDGTTISGGDNESEEKKEEEFKGNIHEKVFEDIPINEEYIVPTTYLSLSKPHDTESWKKEIRRNSELLKNTLADFGIDAEVVNVNRGPVITLYEMQIAPGIKVNRVASLADDIAMALAAQRVRIVAPIPGKSAIGIEIPNRYREAVTLGDIIKSEEFKAFQGSLAVALGKDILGNPVMLDLKRQPHLLIAGATGAGKSVCVNSIITSLIYNYEPNYLRFILIDPKMVELQLYNGLPHLLTPVIVDPQTAPMVLKWAMHEMQRRYCLLSDMNTRDIERYNDKIGRGNKGIERMPYIVIIIDEMADLMMTSKEVEGYITRIAQKARAVGIHLVVATQRPSVDIITGIIKANFPARIAFQVAQKNDSRTIIDQNGAEKLLGRGDMLYQPPTGSYPIRVQGGFISEEEIETITGHLRSLARPSYIDIEESLREEESKDLEESTDELFLEAIKIVEETKKASASYLQRRLSIGYNRAARIIEQMEEMGYIGPQIGSKPREVLI